jgi:hypothetical protein
MAAKIEPVGVCCRPPSMRKSLSIISRLIVAASAIAANAGAAPLRPSLEERYIAARDAAIAKFSPIYDAGKFDDTA